MFGADVTILAVAGLAMLFAGGIAYVFIYPILSGEKAAEKRIANVQGRRQPGGRIREADGGGRQAVLEKLQKIEEKQKHKEKKGNKSVPMPLRLERAGLNWNSRHFYLFSATLGLMAVAGAMLSNIPFLVSIGIGVVGAFGAPRWYISFRTKRRIKQFVNEFPNTVDVIVRGIKAGLPLGDCLNIITRESPSTVVREEFQKIIDAQKLGMPMYEAISRLYDRIPIPEANFFCIVIAIQQKAGGNLSEVLGNLSKVLRDRKKMAGKIQAMSMEAKASAGIIGSLPVVVMILVYLTSPDYILLLFTERLGNVMLLGCAFWMFCGIMVMRKMINFDF
ncbi:MAG: type II secretion system F family protein [Hyphomicrobiales bacterium]|nr:type II secretion system F family protein [Hyphomicrobiales bacterium]